MDLNTAGLIKHAFRLQMSVVLITHRAELLGIVDRVVVVEGGGVVS